MRRRIDKLVVKLFPLRKGACANERREIMRLRAWKELQVKRHVEQLGEAKLTEYEQTAAGTSSQSLEQKTKRDRA